VNQPESKLAKRTSVHSTLQCRILPMNHTVTVFFVDMTLVKFGMIQQNSGIFLEESTFSMRKTTPIKEYLSSSLVFKPR
jgi:hypothetical protein